jgi:ketosteroid isomerase-like protein
MSPVAIFVLTARLLAPFPSAAEEGTLAEFRRIERDRAEALRLGDADAVDRLYADDFVGVSRTGQVVRKPELLRTVRGRGVNNVTFTMVELELRWINGLAFVLGHHVGKDASGRLVREGRVLHVYARRDGQWKVVSAQATPLVR